MENNRHEKIILLATDFSPGAERALRDAVRMAEVLAARLDIVHICHSPMFSRESEVTHVVRAGNRLEALRARVAEKVPCELHLHSGAPLRGLLDVIDSLRPMLVIIGSAGHGVVRRTLLGSLSEGLRRRSPVRVVVAPVQGRSALGEAPGGGSRGGAARIPELPYLATAPTLYGTGSALDSPRLW